MIEGTIGCGCLGLKEREMYRIDTKWLFELSDVGTLGKNGEIEFADEE